MAKRVPLNDSYNYLRKSYSNLNRQQSSGNPPNLYPKRDGHNAPSQDGSDGGDPGNACNVSNN